MNKLKIITDSNSGILQKEAEELGIFVIPMPFSINGEEFFEEISMTQEKFYEYMDQDADIKTSQPSQFYLEETWEELLKDNEELLYIPMSSGLSKTCDNAKFYAEKFEGKVHVVDNCRISVTQKESVFEAIELAKKGKSAKAIKEYLEDTKDNHSIYIMTGTLKYLKKGGRISAAAATLGAMLNVKPVLSSRGDKFEKFALVLSPSQAKKKMIQKIKSELENEFNKEYKQGKVVISVAHTQNEVEANKFKEQILNEIPNITFKFVDPLSLSVACHIGPGALAIAMSINNYLN